MKIKLSKSQWEYIGAAAGWMKGATKTAARMQMAEEIFPVTFDDPTKGEQQVNLEVTYDIVPGETVDGAHFLSGAIDFRSIKTQDPVSVNGKDYPAGTELTDEMVLAMDLDGAVYETREKFEQALEEYIKSQNDIPTEKYRW